MSIKTANIKMAKIKTAKIKMAPTSAFKAPGRKTRKFHQTQIIRQVGAKPIKTRRGTLFKLGGGLFSRRQIVASRKRLVRMKAPSIARRAGI